MSCKMHKYSISWCSECVRLPTKNMTTKKYMVELTTELEKFRKALNEIATMHQIYYERNETGIYSIGTVDGHRCAAKVAKEALK